MLAAITGKLPLSIERFESERLGLRIDLGGELASGRSRNLCGITGRPLAAPLMPAALAVPRPAGARETADGPLVSPNHGPTLPPPPVAVKNIWGLM